MNSMVQVGFPIDKDDKKEACKTFVEQTKLLVTLASAFVVAPPIVKSILDLTINVWVVSAEVVFILSVLAGYCALGAVAGSQHRGEFNVYRKAVRISGLIQFFSYLIGLCLFLYWLITQG